MEADHTTSSPPLRSRGPEPRASTFDDAPLLEVSTLEVATESVPGYNGADESFSTATSGLRLKRIIVALATVGLLATVLACAWAVDRTTPEFATPPEPNANIIHAFRNDATAATTTHINSHILLQPAPDPAPDDTDLRSPWAAWVATNTTLHPTFASNALTVSVPPGTAASLLRVQIFGMDSACNINAFMCLCGSSDGMPAILRSAAPEVSQCPPIGCPLLLQSIHVPPNDAYNHQQWYKLHLPCTLLPEHEYTIEWVSSADDAFIPSARYPPPADNTTQAASQLPDVGVVGYPYSFLPSTLARGDETAFIRFTVTAPDALTVLTGTKPSGPHTMHDGGFRSQGYKSVQGVSSTMLAVVVGALERLATGFDARHREISVWALPGGTAEDAAVPWAILSNATTAWADFTGQPLPGLGNVDMVVWNGPSPWSRSQHGLLMMDRFRTLWRAGASTATDLVRCAHVICHEIGHLWFGGLLQTLNETDQLFAEESTTSYGEVFCVAAVLPGPLSETEAFTRSFFPEFGDTRWLHTAASFHATANLALPTQASDSVLNSVSAHYNKGPAFLHMLEDYMDAAVMPGIMREAVQGFFRTYAHTAVTATDLLCYLAHALAGCPVGDSASSLHCRPPPPAAADANSSALATVATGSSCATVLPWLRRLQAWLVEPGVQVVEVYQSSTMTTAGNATELQALLLPNNLPGQEQDGVPLWVPVSLVRNTGDADSGDGNGSVAIGAHEQRWLEVYPPWEEKHRTVVGGPDVCVEAGAEGGPECGRPVASSPLRVHATGQPWLPKAKAAPFLVSLPDKGTQDAVTRQLRHLALGGGSMEVGGDHPDMRTLQAFSTLIHDAHTLFSAQPSAARYSFLRALLSAAFAAPAASQAGLGTYLLLGPATDALWELQLLARGDSECANKVAGLEKSMIVHSGMLTWKRLLPRAKSTSGDPSTLSQDELFTRAIAGRLVPRAAHYDAAFAASVCALLQSVPRHATLRKLLSTIGHTPDVQNIVLEVALAAPKNCSASGTVRKAMVDYLKGPDGPTELLPHLRRSASFILAASHDRETLQFLLDAAVFVEEASVESGLRQLDRATLFQRIARTSLTGFRAAAETMQEHGEGTEKWDSDAAFLVHLSPWTMPGTTASLPDWLPLEQLGETQEKALLLRKKRDTAAAQIVCASA